MNWEKHDLEDFASRGIAEEEAERQLALLRDPPRSLELVRAATAGDGIEVVAETSTRKQLSSLAQEAASAGRITKFVPASGAATRMFAELAPALDPRHSLEGGPARFFRELRRFPFYDVLETLALENGVHIDGEMSEDERRSVLRFLLTADGLGYGDLAKGLILFHEYPEGARTAFEEQLREGGHFISDGSIARHHFTVPRSDLGRFSSELRRVTEQVESAHARPEVTFSVQHPATDTIALDAKGDPFRFDDGRLLFRPGGHGSLLRNLQELGGDIVFVKNIDNIRPESAQRDVAGWYQVLIGMILSFEERIHNTLRSLDSPDPSALQRAAGFVAGLGRPWRGDRDDQEAMRRHFIEALDRPLRVCAVVKNEGEPGGAPFWVRDGSGHESLQIVESSQIDMTSRNQSKIFGSSTHFNPVAIACSLRDRDGEPYDLRKWVDPSAAFVANKTHEGRELRALEHPGLWNGAMAGWNSIFVELPPSTFAPVKTVFDLLRPEHQTGGEAR